MDDGRGAALLTYPRLGEWSNRAPSAAVSKRQGGAGNRGCDLVLPADRRQEAPAYTDAQRDHANV